MPTPITQLLARHGMKATPKRMAVLEFLSKQKKPVSAQTIAKAFPKVNRVSIYRMLEALSQATLLTRHDLGHGHDDFELSLDKHHHHIVCTSCGDIEDIMLCSTIDEKALRQSKKFDRIHQHMVTVFGQCKRCAKQSS